MNCEFFFFKQKTAYEMRISDWSSDVCSSDLDRIDHLALADLGIVGAAIDAVDQKIVSVFMFVGEAAHHDAADDRGRPRSGGIVDDALDRRAVQIPRSQFALHGAAAVSAFAPSAPRVRTIGYEPPSFPTNL